MVNDKLLFDTRWFKGMTDKEKESFKKELVSAKKVLDKLHEIVYNAGRKDQEVRLVDYDSPSWISKQAHLNGRMDAFRTIASLVEIKDNEQT